MFERIAIPTPFQVGPVNAYLAGRTIVDPGPDSEAARETLGETLAERDLAFDDVERVLVTHPHPDHFGLANRLADHGADVVASAAAASVVRAFEERLEYEQTYFRTLFECHGMDPESAATVTELPEAFVEFAPSVAVDRELAGGDALSIDGRDVTARELTGHSVGELAFAFDDGVPLAADATPPAADAADLHADDAESRADGADSRADDTDPRTDAARSAIVGDHVLAETTPNPFLQPPPPDSSWDAASERLETLLEDSPAAIDDARPRVLPAYNDSLGRLRAADFDRLLPGHGEPIEEPATTIDELLAAHESRTDAVRELVDGPTTAMEVLQGLFPDLGVVEYFGGMSEALGHLDVLAHREEVERRSRDGELVYVRS